MSESEIFSILSAIETGDFSKALDTITARPKEKATEVFASVISGLNLKTYEQAKQLEQLRLQLAAYQKSEDAESSEFIDGVVSSIVDSDSALKARSLYSLSWFQGLEFSNVVKLMIARRLIDVVSAYNASYVPDLWTHVVQGDPQAVKAITFLADAYTDEEVDNG